MKKKSSNINDRILLMSDTHAPWEHPDALEFMCAVRDCVNPTRVIHGGDISDRHSNSTKYAHDPDSPSPGDEDKMLLKSLRAWYREFPNMDVVYSNHDDRVIKQAIIAGIPERLILNRRQQVEAPDTWMFHEDLTIKLPDGNMFHIRHGSKINGINLTKHMGMCTAQGHYHARFCIQYFKTPASMIWALQLGCLADPNSRNMAYGKNAVEKPILGCAAVIDGHPQLFPMELNKKGRWTGYLI